VAVETPAHGEGLGTLHQWHLIDAAVAFDAGHAAVDVDGVVEVDVVREVGDALPPERNAGREAGADRGEHLGAGPELGMAGHADLGGRQARVLAGLDGGMAVAAVDAEASDVMLVTERHRLVHDPADMGDVARSDVAASDQEAARDHDHQKNQR
jgi:hypothetical protein